MKVEFCLKRKMSLIFFLAPASFVSSLSYNIIANQPKCKDHGDFHLGDWIGLFEAVEPGALQEEGAHSKKSLQVLRSNYHQI